MFTIQYTKDVGRAVAMSMLPPSKTKPITLPWQLLLTGKEKKEEYAKPLTKGRGVSYWKIALTTVAVTLDLPSGMPLVLYITRMRQYITRMVIYIVYYPNNSILAEWEQHCAQLSKLIRLTAFKKVKHTVCWWYWTVYIPWLVASYDTHKGERWLNSNPQATEVYI